ncbi:hypothetical protein N7513_003601 [Penicillium frequentans]|nr:hypothetical protein N7513_003601 [Penicillium glabrum]
MNSEKAQDPISYTPGGDQVMQLAPPPPASFGPEWSHSFWEFWSRGKTCFVGCYCPGFLFGRTQARNKDPTLSNYSRFNSLCCAWHCLAWLGGWQFILQAIKRGDMRDQYGIRGNGVTDCLGACCCPVCALIQEEKESLQRTQGAMEYQRPQGMSYP